MSYGKCRGCGAEIAWIKTRSGKSMPCDPRLEPYWARKGAKGKILTPNGDVVSCDFEGNLSEATGVGYVPHFATCPNADSFRRKKR